jgi:hypothetical protein
MDSIVHGKKSEICAQIEPQVQKPKRKGKGFLNAATTSNKGVQGSNNTPLRNIQFLSYFFDLSQLGLQWMSAALRCSENV